MVRKYILPAVALIGIFLALLVASRANKTLPPAAAVSAAPQPPYRAFVAGVGIIEANTENIAIGTQIAGIVSKIYVQIGSQVKTGDPLFTIDDRAQRALIATDTADVNATCAQMELTKYQVKVGNELIGKKVISQEDLETRRRTADTAEARYLQAQANLEAAKTDLERLTVRSPVDGQIMQLKIHLGEFAPTGVLTQPLILLGNVEPMNVRVNVDENDAWRVRGNADAIGYLRGNNQIRTLLRFVRFEPYVVPKVSLTGDSTERVDTRVLQVVYSFDRGNLPIYVGQQMDVYIDASLEQNRETAAH
ncbi:MAG TPA: efflux RND transporter periplasmic adaptor subunit [Chthoniobacterales bacterium]|nr:efflux RND transporter periplasmic adaptor subunit [Chthoniobacterales bacterium]